MKYLKTIFKNPYYLIIAINGALGLAILYWWLLTQSTTVSNFLDMVRGEPVYLYLYAISTFAVIILFGVNLALSFYLYHSSARLSGASSLKENASNVGGGVVGAFASACPTCGAFLLSLVGVGGGLAIFPLKGLEFKFLSLILIILALYLSLEKLSKNKKIGKECKKCAVEDKKVEYNYSLPVSVLILFSVITFSAFSGNGIFKISTEQQLAAGLVTEGQAYQNLYEEIVAKVLPEDGFKTNIRWQDVGVQLASYGVIDLDKFRQLYQQRNNWDEKKEEIFTQDTSRTLYIDAENSNFMVNTLWALGLSNKNSVLEASPMATNSKWSLFNFASTGGWTLGKNEKGGDYYSKFLIIELTEEQQETVAYIVDRAYRPCCNNPTSFPDCNHGAALLGLLELGASQGLSQNELWDVALKFNSFWFPQQYVETALYFKVVEDTDWEDVNPEKVLGYDYSSASGWRQNVSKVVNGIPGLLPEKQGGGGCGV